MSDILDYRIFVRVATRGSLSAAARDLRLSLPVVSKRVSRLEARMAVRLFQRTTRRLSLTEAGRAFYEHISSALTLIEEAESTALGAATTTMGVLKVSAPTVFTRLHVAPRLAPLLQEYPELKLDLKVSDLYVDLVSEEMDVAIRIGIPEDSSLVARYLAPDRQFFCTTPDYIARYGAPETLEELAGHRLLAPSNVTRWKLSGPEGPIVFRPRSAIVTNSGEVVREMVRNGMGIGLRSTWDVSDELRSGRLVRVLPVYQGAEGRGIYAVYASRVLVPLKIRVFVDFLRRMLGPEPYWDEGLRHIIAPGEAGR